MARTPEHIYEELLATRARAGEVEAFDELLRRWQRPLLAHARRMTDSPEAAWDVLQESLLSMARNIRRLEDPATFRTWAYRIVSRRAADWVRGRKRERSRREPAREEPSAEHGENDETGDVRSALRRLSDEEQSLLALRYHAELPVAHIAVALGMPVGTVKSRLHAARERLRAMLEPEQELAAQGERR